MPSFRFIALSPAGEVVRGDMEGASVQAVLDAIRRQGNTPVKAEAASKGLGGLLSMQIGGPAKLTKTEVAEVTRELSIMLGAGQDLDRALRFLVETAGSKRVAAILDGMRAGVRDGASFATVLARYPASFPKIYVGLVRAGEAGGQLAATLERLAVLLERQRSLSATVTSALIYPALLLVAAVGAIVLLLTQVLPQFVPLFEQNGAAIPTPTKILIGLGDGGVVVRPVCAAGFAGRRAVRAAGAAAARGADRGRAADPAAAGAGTAHARNPCRAVRPHAWDPVDQWPAADRGAGHRARRDRQPGRRRRGARRDRERQGRGGAVALIGRERHLPAPHRLPAAAGRGRRRSSGRWRCGRRKSTRRTPASASAG